MRIKFIERLSFRLRGRAIPVIKAGDISSDGQVRSLFFMGDMKKRPNSLVNTWDEKGWEIQQGAGYITMIDEKGLPKDAYIVSESGKTVNLYIYPRQLPNLEDVIGHAATMDDIADAMDLGRSMKNLAIGAIIGILVGAFAIGPMIQAMMK